MCGIVGFTGKSPAAGFLLDGLEKLEYRGYDSAGIVVSNKAEFSVEKTMKRINDLKEKTDNGNSLTGTIGIGHTRWATHGAPSLINAHPHLSFDSKFAVVHNGIIENHVQLANELKEQGISFTSETDTEVVPHLIAMYYRGDFKEAVLKAVNRLEGSFALGIICKDYPDTIIAAKKFSPLIVGLSKDANFISSDVTALISHTRDMIYLNDNEIAVITPESASVYDFTGKEIKHEISVVDWDIKAAEKAGYDHFMLKEIHEQPYALGRTIETRTKNGRISFEGIKLSEEKLKTINRIDFVACGSAYHAGIVGKYVFEELLRIPTDVHLASEYRYRNPISDERTLTIVISQSGETADTLAALKEAKSRGSYILSIINVVGSSIAKASDDVIYTWAGPEIAVATTKGYTTQLSVIYMIAHWIGSKLKTASEERLKEFYDGITKIPALAEEILKQESKIKEFAKKTLSTPPLFYIGRNIDYAVAMEASLKLKEISYIHSEAYAAGELKHGAISLIEEGKSVVALACYESLYSKLLSNIKEVKARGGYIISTATEGNTEIEEVADAVIYIPHIDPLLIAPLEIIPYQLYAYYFALYKGCDIDKPRNLAKSVTVE